jgi:hypothetical protein
MVSSCEESLGIANFFSLGVVILRLVSMGMGCIRECDHCSFVARSVDGVLQEMCMGGDLPYSLSRAVWLPPAWSLAHAICSTETVVRGPSQVCRSLLFHGTRQSLWIQRPTNSLWIPPFTPHPDSAPLRGHSMYCWWWPRDYTTGRPHHGPDTRSCRVISSFRLGRK